MPTEKLGWLLTLLKDYLLYKMFYHSVSSNGQLRRNINSITQIWLIYNSLQYSCVSNPDMSCKDMGGLITKNF